MNEHQQTKPFSPDDHRLTAYALGELSGAERAEVETILKNDPEARAAVEEIRALARQLEGALAAEALAEPVTNANEGGLAKVAKGSRAKAGGEDDPYRRKIVRFPYVWVGTLAAACFAVVFALLVDRRDESGGLIATSETTVTAEKTAASSAEGDGVLAKKPAGAFSMTGPVPAAESGRGVFLVQDAEEAARLPAVDKDREVAGAGESSRNLDTVASGTSEAQPGAIFAQTLEPIPTVVTLGENVSEIPAPARAVAEIGRVTPATSEGDASGAPARSPSQPAAETGGGTTILAQASVPGSTAVAGGTEESIVLNAFSIASDKRARGLAAPRGGRHAVFGGESTGAVANSDDAAGAVSYGGSLYFYDGYSGPRMNFRAKSTAPARPIFNTEAYSFIRENDFMRVRNEPLSTFSIDVDTASYANVRRFLDHGQRPPKDAVRVEEMVNYFNYRYAPPANEVTEPFAASMEIATAPWNPAHRLVRIGLKGREIATEERPAANLVFLLDVSGSMDEPNKLPLVKESLRMLVEKLRADDRVAVVTYAGASGLALASTPAGKKKEILAALDELTPGGSTNGAMGIQLAYDIAKANFIEGGANRVILCTDGDFNVGTTSDGELTRLIEEKAKSGVFLTVLGFGMGNYKDSTLERLADKGNGNYGYIDSRVEAQRLLVEQAGGTLVTIAKDVKLQVEFNPEVAQAYRLIGYENRALKKEDFNNDKVDAGEIGAGHTVTALYEIVPVGAPAPDAASGEVDALKYQKTRADGEGAVAGAVTTPGGTLNGGDSTSEELLTLKIRFKEPTVDVSRKMEIPVIDTGAAFEAASKDFKFAAAVASLGMILRESVHAGQSDYDRIISWAEAGKGEDADGKRGEFIELVKKARTLSAE